MPLLLHISIKRKKAGKNVSAVRKDAPAAPLKPGKAVHPAAAANPHTTHNESKEGLLYEESVLRRAAPFLLALYFPGISCLSLILHVKIVEHSEGNEREGEDGKWQIL